MADDTQRSQPFLTDLKTIRQRARQSIEEGAVTPDYAPDRELVVRLLNEVLATELVCTMRYKSHYYRAQGLRSEVAAAEFLEHANEEQEHADRVAERITQLGGKPEFNPNTFMSRSHSDFVEGDTLEEMIREDLIAERIAIQTYRELAAFFDKRDPTTRRLIEDLLAVEEEHADDLANLLVAFGRPDQPAQGGGDDAKGGGGADAARTSGLGTDNGHGTA